MVYKLKNGVCAVVFLNELAAKKSLQLSGHELAPDCTFKLDPQAITVSAGLPNAEEGKDENSEDEDGEDMAASVDAGLFAAESGARTIACEVNLAMLEVDVGQLCLRVKALTAAAELVGLG
jgi:hypothetical protein